MTTYTLAERRFYSKLGDAGKQIGVTVRATNSYLNEQYSTHYFIVEHDDTRHYYHGYYSQSAADALSAYQARIQYLKSMDYTTVELEPLQLMLDLEEYTR